MWQQLTAPDKAQLLGKGMLATGLFALAVGLAYFSYEISSARQDLPELLTQLENTSQKIEPVLREANAFRGLVPPILEETKAIREAITATLAESAELRKTVPPLISAGTEAIAAAGKTMGTIGPHIPAILSEVKKTRESLPGILDRADKVVAHAESVGQAASKGAVKGFLGGIVTAPFKLISEAGRGLTDAIGLTTQSGFTKEDDRLNQDATDSLLKSGAPGTQQQWSNPASGNSGTIHWISQALRGNRPCVTLHYDIKLSDGKTHEARVELCQQSDGSWKKWKSE